MSVERPRNLQEVIELTVKQQQAKLASESADAQLRIATATFDKAATYATVVIFGGYAGFFALWQLAKDAMTKQQVYWSALLILVSLFAFVAFEIAKMVHVSVALTAQARVLQRPDVRASPLKLQQELAKFEARQKGWSLGIMILWHIAVGTATVTGLGAAGVVAYSFVTALAKAAG
ncbi:Uncharacterised protein [Xylophilus ampelinus]|nr:hypothetical protein [Variovorax sp.]VTY37140.1 Uncharacterised protein [Xylophilus ampelinus]|tara:strand:- start:953 stop:1480 length:528 start_codon:yes stop_codon:yes gene_type:complete